MILSQTARHIQRIALLATLLASLSAAQEVSLMPNGSEGICATALVNDPATVREAWMNTLSLHPGIVEAVQRTKLQRSTSEYRLGDQNLFWVYNLQKKVFDTVRAEVKSVGTMSYVWVALGEWSNSHVTATEVNAIMNALEHSTSKTSLDSTKGLLEITRQVYGNPPNIGSNFQKGGGDGKTHFLICDIQDGWSGTGSYVAGFFYSVDVDPNTGYVSYSNRRDMLYIDSYPGIFLNGRYRTSTALSTLSHEFQHLIHWNFDPNEVTFFNEGLSEYAEYLCGFDLRSPHGYLGNVNLPLTVWNGTLEDYSRAALWTRFVAEQYGTTFLKNFVQNATTGTTAFEQALVQSGIASSFNTTLQNFFTANWLGTAGSDPAMRYKTALPARPNARGDYVDPVVQRTDTVPQQAVQYLRFESAKNFRILFTLPSGMTVRALESGPAGIRIRNVSSGVDFTSPGLGTEYSSILFVVVNTNPVQPLTYSFSASGELLHFLVEELYDSGTPHPFSPGYAPYLGFGNNSPTRGMAVRFQPTVNGNALRKARMLLMFNQEFSNGTAKATDDKDFLFHVWADRNGRPGDDIIPPFLVTVDRNAYPLESFVDVDLSPYQGLLTNLKGPIYIGFMEDANDSVGTYVAVDNFTTQDYSYVYRGPNHPVAPNTWQTMREVSALNNNSLDGFNLMMRAVFEYNDSSSSPVLTVGYLQNTLLSEYIDVVAASTVEMRQASLSGTIAQGTSTVPLRFSAIPGTARAFIDTTQKLTSSGTVSMKVRAARKYGIFYTDTTVSLSARLLKSDESGSISTPTGAVRVLFEPGAVTVPTYVTALDGWNHTQPEEATDVRPISAFFLGPPDLTLRQQSAVTVAGDMFNESVTLARWIDGKWFSVPTAFDRQHGTLTASISKLGSFAVIRRSDAAGELDALPSQFALLQNYPNPFNPVTTIEFDLPLPAMTRLIVYDVLGKIVSRLVDGARPAGHYRVSFDAAGLSSGVYYYRLSAGGYSTVKKLIVLK
jgi:hypothetical protein